MKNVAECIVQYQTPGQSRPSIAFIKTTYHGATNWTKCFVFRIYGHSGAFIPRIEFDRRAIPFTPGGGHQLGKIVMSLFQLQSLSTATRATVAFAFISAGIAAGSAQSSDSDGFDVSKPGVVQSENRSFVDINPAISFAPAYGQFSKSAHGTFGTFPANFETPVHTHTGAYHGIVVKGVMTNPLEGEENPPTMTPGSYWYVPAGMAHATACVSDTPCEFYFHAAGPFDFTPVE
ncbi:MAG: DUF4437 domain-containing protein [Hyphomicrobiales bacterium]|nr:DUF4437 domain-containing protein [Hyphomicrobiales bacterium]